MEYYGRRSNRGAITALSAVLSVIGTISFMIASIFFSLYFGVFTVRYFEKNCTTAGVAQNIGITENELHSAIEHLINGLKKGAEPQMTVNIKNKDVNFFSDEEVADIYDYHNKIVLFRRIAMAMSVISIALFVFVIAESRARILRNVFAVFWGIIILATMLIMLYVKINPSTFMEGFAATVILNGRGPANAANGYVISLFPSQLIENAVIFVSCLFIILQLIILLIINKFTLHR
ncbi:MAG: DUF1461 domain-containing protein [Lachnospiraceae bacterium]|nr:DUF1461 domain-containing protein [Lachnospiraceae bacterium]